MVMPRTWLIKVILSISAHALYKHFIMCSYTDFNIIIATTSVHTYACRNTKPSNVDIGS